MIRRSVVELDNTPNGVIKGNYNQMCRGDSKHVLNDSIYMFVSESITIGN